MKYEVIKNDVIYQVVDENGGFHAEGICLSNVIMWALMSLDEDALIEVDPDMKCHNCEKKSCVLF